MKYIKMLGLAMVAAIAASALVASSASAEGNNFVVCKENVILCPSGSKEPEGASLIGLALNPVLLGAIDQECEHSEVKGAITSTNGMGNPLLGSITAVTFTKECDPCATVTASATQLHLSKNAGAWLVKILNPLALFTGCPFGVSCGFKAPGGTNEIHMTATNVPGVGTLINANKVKLVRYHGGFFCGTEGEWDADYIVANKYLSTFQL